MAANQERLRTAIGHVLWEVEHLLQAFDRYRETGDSLVLEAFLLHARNLIDFFQAAPCASEMRCQDFGFIRPAGQSVMNQKHIGDINNNLSHLAWSRRDDTIKWLRPGLWIPLFDACSNFARHISASDVFGDKVSAEWRDLAERRIKVSAQANT